MSLPTLKIRNVGKLAFGMIQKSSMNKIAATGGKPVHRILARRFV
ncbi:MAG: hypothetical protein ABSG78_09680 [Verrucomicrobiota bacterium]|jgi:hypothetical protein